MQGQSHRLEVRFEPAPRASLLAKEADEAKRSRENLQAAVKQVPGQTVSANVTQKPDAMLASQSRITPGAPLAPAPSESEDAKSIETNAEDKEAPAAKKKTDRPIEVVSDLIQVRMLTYPGERKSEVSEVWTQGHVQVRQMHAPDELPLHMTGERLYVQNRAKDDQLMTLRGSPAHVRDRGMHIEGQQISLDRQKNHSKVNGAGLLQLPVKRSLDGEELKEPKLLDVEWEEEMNFDGLNAKFLGNVRAVLNNDGMRSNMRCEEMDVELTRRISFTENRGDADDKDRPNAEIARVFCKDGVEFDSYNYEDTKLTEVRRGHFAEFTVNQVTGDTTGQGPGWIMGWRRGRGKRAGLTPNATVKANRALKPDSAEWEYMRIDFAGTADGNLQQKFNTFSEHVQIIYGPVERALMVIESDNLTKDAGRMGCQNLRITQNEPQEKDQPGHVELLATGNVDLEGRTFNARADSVSFDESKGLYTLRSQGQREATIWRQTQLGGDLSRADARLMYFIPARNILKLDQAIGLDGVN
jgi:lipopolysaccharide export system protein LptA